MKSAAKIHQSKAYVQAGKHSSRRGTFLDFAGKSLLMKTVTLLSTFLIGLVSSTVYAQENMRPSEIQACTETTSPTLVLDLWDAGVEDNDSIRLYLNGKNVLDHFRLSKAKQQVTLTLQPGINELSLFALNLGDIPNNTAALAINGKEKVSLNSGLAVNGTLQLIYKAPGMMTITQACPPDLQKPDDDEAKLIRSNPNAALPSYTLLQKGIRLNAGEGYRKIDVQDCYTSSSKEVELLVWDCGAEDNDTVSLYLNGQWILQNFRLTKAPFALPVTLIQGENVLILYAHNLGDIPKNTAAVSVKNRYSEQEVGMMISDQNTSGAIRISYGMSDDFGNTIPPCLDENKVDSTREPEVVYLNSLTAPVPPSYGNPAPRSNPPVVSPRPTPPPVVVPVPVPSPRPSPPPTPPSTTPKPSPGGRQPGDNPGGGVRNKPKPNY